MIETCIERQVFLGRQPILDRRRNLFGYELLYRSGEQNAYSAADANLATQAVIHNSLNVMDLDEVAGSHRVFINITQQLLLDRTYSLLPKERAVIELLETIEPTDEVVAACRAAKRAGYMLALDDFVMSEAYRKLLPFADIIKVDFRNSTLADRNTVFDEAAGHAILLAEKVETHEQFEEAIQLGFTYFQGYFFCKPEIIKSREIPSMKSRYMRFAQEVNKPVLNFDALEEVIKSDVSLSAKLLRYLNSPALGFRQKIDSIKQSLVLIGERPLRRWATIVALSAIGSDKPEQLFVTCLVRARFCELIASHTDFRARATDLFMMGLLSGLDGLMDQPLEQLLSSLPITADVRAALLGSDRGVGKVYALVQALERFEAENIDARTAELKLSANVVADCYKSAIKWADQCLK